MSSETLITYAKKYIAYFPKNFTNVKHDKEYYFNVLW